MFVAYGAGHIAKVAPVAKVLQAQGVPCLVLALTVGYAAALRLGLQPLGYRDFKHLADPRAPEVGRTMLEGNQHPDVDEHESCCYLGINYLDWVEQFGEQEARNRYERGGRRSFHPIRFIGRVIDELRPVAVVSTGSPRSEQAALEAAQARGIPSLTIMDLFGLPYDPYLRQEIKADRITVMSEMVRANLLRAGVPAGRIRVTGCPGYDALYEPAHAAAAAQWRREMGWEHLRVVMWAGYKEEGPAVPPQWSGIAFCTEVERRLRDWVSSRQDVALLVRYHPNQFHHFPDLGPQERVYVAQPPVEPIQVQLHASDTVIVQTSTVGFEAMLIGKRMLNLQYAPSVIELGFDYCALGMAEGVASMEELVPVLERPQAVKVKDDVLPPPGPAAPRVAAEIRDLMRLAGRTQG